MEKIATSLKEVLGEWLPGRYRHETFNELYDAKPKHHTIREDTKDRWKVGSLIHFVVFNRSKNQFQFAPVFKCKGIQKIEITHYVDWIAVTIDGRNLGIEEIIKLSINDGFDGVEAFFNYFNCDYKGKIIHWTDLRY
ncbi:hypothetical protein R1T16_17380 [Flavobacterium sp. DG1-102-2]|uniref:hypothetical protein n=1 Tax=Flavobacterium sp. DG1-102-2 TaxID=3081663 RepID=UPI0029493BC9|nr:hypothetical protein [Flavobacterium sp. DG1-102-2]MDV6170212.1 hypothetical protein [Flavobacterium sp. DG1-102-2]